MTKEYYQRNRERICARARADYRNRTEQRKLDIHKAYLKRTYGITLEDYERMFKEQNGVCALCGKPPLQRRFKRLHVDHCHKTGKVRGLLCRGCNGLLGWLEQNELKIKDYLNG